MAIAWWQILLLTMLAFWMIIDQITVGILTNYPLLYGFVSGIIMGDVKTGLVVGATLQLMVLGVGTYGGASMPDFMTGAIIGTAYAVISGKGINFAIGLAVPVGLLMVQLDVLARFTNTFFLHRVDRYIEKGDTKRVARNIVYGVFPWGLSRAIPVSASCRDRHFITLPADKTIYLVLSHWLSGSGLSQGADAGRCFARFGISHHLLQTKQPSIK